MFSAPAERGTRTALACSPFPGGEFSAEPQRGDSPSADGGSVPRPAAGAKRKDNLRFSFLFELLPFPCFLIWRRLPTCDRCEIGERQSGYRSVSFSAFSQFTDSVLLHRRFTLRRRDTSVSRNSFTRCYRQFLRITIINNLYRMVRQGELPEGQESVPCGITVPRSFLTRYTACHLRINLLINTILQESKFLLLQSKTTVKTTVVCIKFSN